MKNEELAELLVDSYLKGEVHAYASISGAISRIVDDQAKRRQDLIKEFLEKVDQNGKDNEL